MLGDYIAELCVAFKDKDKEAAEKILKKLEVVGMDRNTAIALVEEEIRRESSC